jgi:hypothetical protein
MNETESKRLDEVFYEAIISPRSSHHLQVAGDSCTLGYWKYPIYMNSVEIEQNFCMSTCNFFPSGC